MKFLPRDSLASRWVRSARQLGWMAAAIALGWAAGGCTTYPKTVLPADAAAQAPVQFSDDVSRDLVRQTRRLLALQKEDYRVGPDDVLEISIFEWEMGEETKTIEFRVAESGIITLPVLGSIEAGNRTVREIQEDISGKLEKGGIIQNPRVAVSVKEFRSLRISVIGAVNAPGVYAIHENVTTLMDILPLAGGPSPDAGQAAHILRKASDQGGSLKITVDMEELFERGNYELNPVLQGGDVVVVPPAPLIYVYGRVNGPGGFKLSRHMRVLEAVALAGGVAPLADTMNSVVIRKAKAGGEEFIPIDLGKVERGQQPNIYLQAGDLVNVPKSMAKSIFSEAWDVVRGIFTFTYQLNPKSQ